LKFLGADLPPANRLAEISAADFPREKAHEKFQEEFLQERRTKNFRRRRLAGGKSAVKNFKGGSPVPNRPLKNFKANWPVPNRSLKNGSRLLHCEHRP
jgi:hypothetical protein